MVKSQEISLKEFLEKSQKESLKKFLEIYREEYLKEFLKISLKERLGDLLEPTCFEFELVPKLRLRQKFFFVSDQTSYLKVQNMKNDLPNDNDSLYYKIFLIWSNRNGYRYSDIIIL